MPMELYHAKEGERKEDKGRVRKGEGERIITRLVVVRYNLVTTNELLSVLLW